MHYVYVLMNLKDKIFYTGYTEHLKNRFEDHFMGRISSTRNRRPLKLVSYEACLEQKDALRREKYLKTTWGKRFLKNRLKSSLESLEELI